MDSLCLDDVFAYPRMKKSTGVRSELLTGRGIGLLPPVHQLENLALRECQTLRLKWGRAPACWKIITVSFSL
jgi:hypothetical protein